MGFRNEAYAKVWSVSEGKGNYLVADISINKKNKETDQYEKDFSYKFVRLIGKAKDKGANLPAGARIKITQCDVSYTSYQDKDGNWQNSFQPKIFDFEFDGDSAPTTDADGFINMGLSDDDDYSPFN